MRRKGSYFLLLTALFLFAACQREGTLSVNSAWARPGNAGGNSAAYFTINNPTSQPDLLLAVDCDIAAHAEIHMSRIKEDGTTEMRPQENVPVPTGGSVHFEPGGLHVMLVDLKQPIQPGEPFDLRLTFQNSGEMIVNVEVREN